MVNFNKTCIICNHKFEIIEKKYINVKIKNQ